MKHSLALLLCVLAVMGLSCSKKKPVLHVYNWGDYLSQAVVEKFESEFGCEVKVDAFDSNEAMYAKLQSGAGGYDIVVPSSYQAKMMYAQGMLEKLDLAKMPNVQKYFDRSYQKLMIDKELAYTVPYFVSFTGIGYNSSVVKNFVPTWKMFEREDIKGRSSLLDDQRETLGASLLTLGYSANTHSLSEIDAAVAQILKWKKNIAKFGVDDTKQSLASGEFILIHTYSGDMLQVMAEKPEIKFVIPKEGSTVTFDCFSIMANSAQKDLAYKFINFIYDTDNCVANMNEIMYVTPHTEAVKQVDESLRNSPAFNIAPEDRERCVATEDLGEAKKLFDTAWDEVKSKE